MAKRKLVLPRPDDLYLPEGWPPGIQLVSTRRLLLAIKAFPLAVSHADMAALHGASGTGKTTAACVAAVVAEVPWALLEVAPGCSGAQVEIRMITTLSRFAPAGSYSGLADTRAGRQDQLRELMRTVRLALILDEADRLGFDGAEAIRYARAQRALSVSIILVGHKLDSFLRTNPATETRLEVLAEFKPLAGREMLEVVKKLHPLAAATPDEMLRQIDRQYSKGLLRRWAKLLVRCARLASKVQATTITPDLYAMALATRGVHP